MTRKYWTEDELNALRHGFEFHVGLPWDRAVECTADAGTVRGFHVSRDQWARVAAIVGTRDADQCAKRLQTERRMEQERRANVRPVEVQPELAMPAQEPNTPAATWARILAAQPDRPPFQMLGLDVSPYLGKAKGRIVLSFNGRGAA